MTTPAFKNGDKVRVIEGATEDRWHAFDVGDEGVISECGADDYRVVRAGGLEQWVLRSQVEPITAPEQTYLAAVKALQAAAHAALRAASDTEAMPMVNRHLLRGIARLSDNLVDAGLDTAKGEV